MGETWVRVEEKLCPNFQSALALACRRLRCLFCAHDYHIVCAIHPAGPRGDSCIDFRPNPELEGKRVFDFLGLQLQQPDSEPQSNPHDYLNDEEELWQPEFACYYNGELILQPQQRWSREEMQEMLDIHPIFTSKCPQCNSEFDRDYTARVHWDCPECGWMDDTV